MRQILEDAQTAVFFAGGIFTLIGAVWALLNKVKKAFRASVLEIVSAQGETLSAELAEVKAELTLNGGKTVKDKVNTIAKALGV